MSPQAIDKAAALLAQARRTRVPLSRLPEDCRPATLEDAFAIEEATVAHLGERIAGWKVARLPEGELSYGIILGSRVLRSGDVVDSRDVPLLGMEGEIAFRFVDDAPARDAPYDYDDIARRVVAFPLIEVVATRFTDYQSTPILERTADLMSNGAFVVGDDQPDWRSMDLLTIPVSLAFDQAVVVERNGGHAIGDPLRLAIDLANRLRSTTGIAAGQMVTTGAYTGMVRAKPGQRVAVRFAGFPVCEVGIT